MTTDHSDPFDPLSRIDPPDQWDDITSRAAEDSVDLHLDVEAERRDRRPRTRATLAVAAALLLVVGGIALARAGDGDDGELNATDGRSPGDALSGACPLSLDLGEDGPVLEPGTLSLPTPSAALTPPTVGRVELDGIQATVAVSTFPTSEVQQRSRWSTLGEGVAVGWLDDDEAVLLAIDGPAGTQTVIGGGHLGQADEACRDVFVQVAVPDPSGGPGATETTQPAPGASSTAGPDATVAPTTATTDGGTAVSDPGLCVDSTRCPELSGDDADPEVDPSTTTTTSTVPVGQSGSAASCVGPPSPCDDTEGSAADANGLVVPEEVVQRGQDAIDMILGAIRFPEPAPTDDGGDTDVEDWTAVPGECPFYLDPAAGLGQLDPGGTIEPAAALVRPTLGLGRVEDAALTVAVGTFPPGDVQRQDRWSSQDEAVAIGWLDGDGVAHLRDAAGLQEDAVGPVTVLVVGGGHLGGTEETCRDVLVLAYVGDGTETSPDPSLSPTTEAPTTTTTTAPADGATAPPFDTDGAEERGQVLIEDVLQAVRFPGDEGPSDPTVPSTTTGSEPAPTEGDDASITGSLTGPAGQGYEVSGSGGGVCALIEGEPEACTIFNEGGDTSLTLTSSAPGRSSLFYGLVPSGEGTVVLVTADGERIPAPLSADGRVWAIADPSAEPFRDASAVTILHVLSDGTETELPPA